MKLETPLPEYYKTLELPNHIQSTPEEIKSSYRRLALANHPDKNQSPSATVAFQLINEAYRVLSNEKERK
jgi:curved DNA-binding protein CbpA